MQLKPVDISRASKTPHVFFRICLVLILYLFVLSASLLRLIEVPLFEVSLLCFAQIFLSSLYLALGEHAVITTFIALTIDSIFISLLIFLLGIYNFPPFFILYALIILYSGLSLREKGGIGIAIISALGYLAVWYWHYRSGSSNILFNENVFFQLFMTSSLMLVVGYASGALGVMLQEKSDELWQAYQDLDWQKSQIEAMNWKISEQYDELLRTHEALKQAQEKLQDYAKNLERKVEEQTRQLIQAEKMSTLGTLVAGISHEIKNSLGPMKTSMSTLKEMFGVIRSHPAMQGEIAPKVKYPSGVEVDPVQDISETLELFDAALDSADNVVQNLYKFVYPSKGKGSSKKFDINQGLKTTLEVVKHEFRDLEIKVHTQFGNIPLIEGDAGAFNQVFMNLLVNAAHAIRERKEKENNAWRGEVWIETTMERECIQVKIRDTGCGIQKESLSKLFDAFYTTKPQGKGTGLGLSVAYQVVQLHGGTILVESDVGVGSQFTISLPHLQS